MAAADDDEVRSRASGWARLWRTRGAVTRGWSLLPRTPPAHSRTHTHTHALTHRLSRPRILNPAWEPLSGFARSSAIWQLSTRASLGGLPDCISRLPDCCASTCSADASRLRHNSTHSQHGQAAPGGGGGGRACTRLGLRVVRRGLGVAARPRARAGHRHRRLLAGDGRVVRSRGMRSLSVLLAFCSARVAAAAAATCWTLLAPRCPRPAVRSLPLLAAAAARVLAASDRFQSPSGSSPRLTPGLSTSPRSPSS